MRSVSALFVLPALLLASCGATFDVDVESSTTIPKGGFLEQLAAVTFGDFGNMDISQSQGFKNAGVEKDQVDSVKLASLELKVESPAGGTFEWLDKMEFFVETEGQPKKRIAHKDAIPDSATTITFDVDDVELAPYVTAPSMNVTTSATARRPNEDTKIQAKLVFTVDPKIF